MTYVPDFEKGLDLALVKRYRSLSDEELEAAYVAAAPGPENDVLQAEHLRRLYLARQKIPKEERRRKQYERFILHEEDIAK